MQERELRAWLLQGDDPTRGATEREQRPTRRSVRALEDAAARRRSASTACPIEVVRVRDCPLDGLEPLLLAAAEGDA